MNHYFGRLYFSILHIKNTYRVKMQIYKEHIVLFSYYDGDIKASTKTK